MTKVLVQHNVKGWSFLVRSLWINLIIIWKNITISISYHVQCFKYDSVLKVKDRCATHKKIKQVLGGNGLVKKLLTTKHLSERDLFYPKEIV